MRLMYDRGYESKTILELFRVIDCMLQVPAALEAAFRHDLYAFEESKQMPYVTTVEQIGHHKGGTDLLLWLIEKKLGSDAIGSVRQRIEATDNDTIRLWSERILTADRVDAIFH